MPFFRGWKVSRDSFNFHFGRHSEASFGVFLNHLLTPS